MKVAIHSSSDSSPQLSPVQSKGSLNGILTEELGYVVHVELLDEVPHAQPAQLRIPGQAHILLLGLVHGREEPVGTLPPLIRILLGTIVVDLEEVVVHPFLQQAALTCLIYEKFFPSLYFLFAERTRGGPS